MYLFIILKEIDPYLGISIWKRIKYFNRVWIIIIKYWNSDFQERFCHPRAHYWRWPRNKHRASSVNLMVGMGCNFWISKIIYTNMFWYFPFFYILLNNLHKKYTFWWIFVLKHLCCALLNETVINIPYNRIYLLFAYSVVFAQGTSRMTGSIFNRNSYKYLNPLRDFLVRFHLVEFK